ncbi:MAG: NAD-dependent epimerase/dehydratase family protein [Polyangiaceae bacterium]|nr:NAD-dependent epimerase/dehydratase family protein [Polyangiaceae bacterium]
MKVLVTGGAGFIGSHIVEAGLARGHELLVLDNLSTGLRSNVPQGVDLLEVDLRDAKATLEAVHKFQPDAICHQAAQASVGLSMERPAQDAENNVVGSLNLLEAALASHVKTFVFASTGGAIYGEIPTGTRATSATLPAPESPYAVGKLAVENYLRLYERNQGLKTSILRYANVYGPRQGSGGEAGVVSVFLNRELNGQPLPIFAQVTRGDDGCVRDYVYVEDVVRANWFGVRGNAYSSAIEPRNGSWNEHAEIGGRGVRAIGASRETSV